MVKEKKPEVRCNLRCDRFHSNGSIGPTQTTLRTDALFLIDPSTTEIQRHVACPLLVSMTLFEEADMLHVVVRGEHDIVLAGPAIPLKVDGDGAAAPTPQPKKEGAGGSDTGGSKEFKSSASDADKKSLGDGDSNPGSTKNMSALNFLLTKDEHQRPVEIDTTSEQRTLRDIYDAILEVAREIDHVVVGRVQVEGAITHNEANMAKSVEFLPIRDKVELRKKGMKRVVPTDVINMGAWDFLVAKPPQEVDEETIPILLRSSLLNEGICMGGPIVQFERGAGGGASASASPQLQKQQNRYLALSSTKVFLCNSTGIESWFFVASLHSIVLYTQTWPPRRMELRLISGTESTAIDFSLLNPDAKQAEKNATVNITIVADFITKVAARHGVSVRSIHQRTAAGGGGGGGAVNGSSSPSPMGSPRQRGSSRHLGRRSSSRSMIRRPDGTEVASSPRNKFDEDSFFTAMPMVTSVSMRSRNKSVITSAKHDATNGIDSPGMGRERMDSGGGMGDTSTSAEYGGPAPTMGSRSPTGMVTPQHSRTASLQPGFMGGGMENFSFAPGGASGGGGGGDLVRDETVASFDSPSTLSLFKIPKIVSNEQLDDLAAGTPPLLTSGDRSPGTVSTGTAPGGGGASAHEKLPPNILGREAVKLRPVFQIKDYLNARPDHTNSLSNLTRSQPLILVRTARRFTSQSGWVLRMVALVEGVLYITERIGTLRRRLFWRDIAWIHILSRKPVANMCIFVSNGESNLVLRDVEGDAAHQLLDVISVLQNSPLVDISVSESNEPEPVALQWINARSPMDMFHKAARKEQQQTAAAAAAKSAAAAAAAEAEEKKAEDKKATAGDVTPSKSAFSGSMTPPLERLVIPPLKNVERFGKVPVKKHLKILGLSETAPKTQSIVYATDVNRFTSRGKWIHRVFVIWRTRDTYRVFLVDTNGKVHRTIPCDDIVRVNVYVEADICSFYVLNENCFILRPDPKGEFPVAELVSVLKNGCDKPDLVVEHVPDHPMDPTEVTMMGRRQSLHRITSSHTLSPINAASPKAVHFKVDGAAAAAAGAEGDAPAAVAADMADDQGGSGSVPESPTDTTAPATTKESAARSPVDMVKQKWLGAVKQISQTLSISPNDAADKSGAHTPPGPVSNASLLLSPIGQDATAVSPSLLGTAEQRAVRGATVSPSRSPMRKDGTWLDDRSGGGSPRRLQLDGSPNGQPMATRRRQASIEYNHDEFLPSPTSAAAAGEDRATAVLGAFLGQEIARRMAIAREQARLYKPSLRVFRRIIDRLSVGDAEGTARAALESECHGAHHAIFSAFDKQVSEHYADLTERLALALKEHEADENAARDAIVITETTLRDRINNRKEDIKVFQEAFEEKEVFEQSTALGRLQHQEKRQRTKISDARKVLWQRTEAQYSDQLAVVLDRRAQNRRQVVKKTNVELTFTDVHKDEEENRQLVDDSEATVRKFALKTFRQDTLLAASSGWISEFYRGQNSYLRAADAFCFAAKEQLELQLHLLLVKGKCLVLSAKEGRAREEIAEMESGHYANMVELSESTLRVALQSTFPSWLVPQLQRVVGEVKASASASLPGSPRSHHDHDHHSHSHDGGGGGEEVDSAGDESEIASNDGEAGTVEEGGGRPKSVPQLPALSSARHPSHPTAAMDSQINQDLIAVIRSLETRVDELTQAQQQQPAAPRETAEVQEAEAPAAAPLPQQPKEPSAASRAILKTHLRRLERREGDGRLVLAQQEDPWRRALAAAHAMAVAEAAERRALSDGMAATTRALLTNFGTRRMRRSGAMASVPTLSADQLELLLRGEGTAREMLRDGIAATLEGLHEHWALLQASLQERLREEQQRAGALAISASLGPQEQGDRDECARQFTASLAVLRALEGKERKRARRLGLVRRAEEEVRRESSSGGLMHFSEVVGHFDRSASSFGSGAFSPSSPSAVSSRQGSSYHHHAGLDSFASPQRSLIIDANNSQRSEHFSQDASNNNSVNNGINGTPSGAQQQQESLVRSKIRVKTSAGGGASIVLTALDAAAVMRHLKTEEQTIHEAPAEVEGVAPVGEDARRATCVFVSLRGGATVSLEALASCVAEHQSWFDDAVTMKVAGDEWESLRLGDAPQRIAALLGVVTC